jgi:hypothetical protein
MKTRPLDFDEKAYAFVNIKGTAEKKAYRMAKVIAVYTDTIATIGSLAALVGVFVEDGSMQTRNYSTYLISICIGLQIDQ